MARDVDKRMLESATEYVDAILDCHSKIEAVRIDLAYTKECSRDVSLERLSEDITHLLANRRGKPSVFGGMVGYMIKSEYAESKGAHAHALFFYDGNKVCKGAYKANQIGEYWRQNITAGDGLFHNCNMNMGRYDKCGVGRVDYSDEDKISVLKDQVVGYMCKSDQDIGAIKQTGGERAFRRGVLPRRKSNAGRPRGNGGEVG